MLALHRWKTGERDALVIPCHSPAHALSEAWLGGRWTVSVISEGWEEVRRPTRWEAEVGRIFCAPAAWAIHRNAFWPRPLPRRLDSNYGLIERRRGTLADPFDWVITDVPSEGVPERTDVRETPHGPEPHPREPRRVRSPPVSDAERVVYAALVAAGGPITERQSELGSGFSSKRERVVRNGSATLYLGYGTWLLLGRDLPLQASGAAALLDAAHRLLERGPMRVSGLLDRLRVDLAEARLLDSPVLLAALLRRCDDVLVDEQSGMAGIIPAHLGDVGRALQARSGMFGHRRVTLPPPVRATGP